MVALKLRDAAITDQDSPTTIRKRELREIVQYEKPKEGNLGDLSCGHNSSLKLKSPHGEESFIILSSRGW